MEISLVFYSFQNYVGITDKAHRKTFSKLLSNPMSMCRSHWATSWMRRCSGCDSRKAWCGLKLLEAAVSRHMRIVSKNSFVHLDQRRCKQGYVFYSKSTHWRVPPGLLKSTLAVWQGSLRDLGGV